MRSFGGGGGGGARRGRGNERGGEPVYSGATSAALSARVRGFRSAVPPREALILVAVANHPWLLETHAEELADLELGNPDADRLRRAMLDAVAHDHAAEPQTLRAALEKRNLGAVLIRVETSLTHFADWPAHAGAAPDDVKQWW